MISRLTIILLLSLSLAACLHLQRSGVLGNRPVELQKEIKIVEEIFIQCGKQKYLPKLNNSSFHFVRIPGRYGECYLLKNLINISSDLWHILSEIEKLEVVLHEVGHCVLGDVTHSNTGIMQAIDFLGPKLKDNFNYYINQYFGCSTDSPCCNINVEELLNND